MVPASSIDDKLVNGSTTATFLKQIFSTITSPSFSKVVVLYKDCDFRGVESWSSGQPPFRHELLQAGSTGEAAGHRLRFEVLREVHNVRAFQLVLCVSVWGCVGEYPVRRLEEAVAEAKAEGAFGNDFSDPVVVYDPQRTRDKF